MRLIPSSIPTTMLSTTEGGGFQVARCGAEETTIDQATGEVCRKRPTLSTVTVPFVPVHALADALTDIMRILANDGDKDADMAHRLLKRAQVHVTNYCIRMGRPMPARLPPVPAAVPAAGPVEVSAI